MAVQLADYRAAVRNLGYDGATDPQLDLAINQARRRVFQDHRWSFLQTTNTALVTVAGEVAVSLAPLTSLLHLESIRLLDGTDPLPLQPMPLQELRDLATDYPDDTGPPRYWARRGGSVLLFPKPDRVYNLDVEHVTYPDDLAAATDDVIPDANQDLVTWAAVVPLAFRQRDAQASTAADAFYSRTLLPRHVAQDTTEHRQASRQVRSGYWQ